MSAACSEHRPKRPRPLAALALFLLAGCTVAGPATPPHQATVPLPPMAGLGDPMRAAVTSAAYTFGDTGRVSGNPAEAARAVARLEWLATELPADPYWNGATPTTAGLLREGRDAVRDAIGIPRTVPADTVARAMIAAAAALDAGNHAAGLAALAPVAPPGDALALLGALPQSRRAAIATSAAYGDLMRLGRDEAAEE